MRRVLVVAAVIVTTLMGGQSQALAADFVRPFEDEIATEGSAPSSPDKCTTVNATHGSGKGCFKKHGDRWYAQDLTNDDMREAYIYWENWLWNGSEWKPYRYGQCNNKLEFPDWGECNKDYYEHSSTNYFGRAGSRIRFQVCIRDPFFDTCNPGNIDWAAWIYNNA